MLAHAANMCFGCHICILESILFHSLQQGVKQVALLLKERVAVCPLFPRPFLPLEWCLSWCLSRVRIAAPARAGIFYGEVGKIFRGREITNSLGSRGHGQAKEEEGS